MAMKCYYKYLNKNRKSIYQILINANPFIVVDIDINGNTMGVEYCDW